MESERRHAVVHNSSNSHSSKQSAKRRQSQRQKERKKTDETAIKRQSDQFDICSSDFKSSATKKAKKAKKAKATKATKATKSEQKGDDHTPTTQNGRSQSRVFSNLPLSQHSTTTTTTTSSTTTSTSSSTPSVSKFILPPDLGDDSSKIQQYFATQKQNPVKTIQMRKAQNMYETRIDNKLLPFVRCFLSDLYQRYGCLVIGHKFFYLPIQLPMKHTNLLFSMVRITRMNRSFPALMVALNIWISTVKQYTSHIQMDPSKIMDQQWLITQSHMALCIQLLAELEFPLITIGFQDISAKYADLWKDPKQWSVILRESDVYYDSFNSYLSNIIQRSIRKMTVVQKTDTGSGVKIVVTRKPETSQLVIYKKNLTVIPEQCPFSFLESMEYVQMWCMNPLNSIGQPEKCGWGSVHVPRIIGWMMVKNNTELDDAKRTQWAHALQDLKCPPLIPCIDANVEEELNRQWHLWTSPTSSEPATSATPTKSATSATSTKTATSATSATPTKSATSTKSAVSPTHDLWNTSHSICYWPRSTDKSEKHSLSPTNMFIDVTKTVIQADSSQYDIVTSLVPSMSENMATTTNSVDDAIDVDPSAPLTSELCSDRHVSDVFDWQLHFDQEKTIHDDYQSQDCAAVFGKQSALSSPSSTSTSTSLSFFSDDFVV